MKTINMEELKKHISDFIARREKIKKISPTIKSDNLLKKHSVELSHVKTFLSLLNEKEFGNQYSLICQRESPDFIISCGNYFIGLEHERLMNSGKEIEESIQSLLDKAAQHFISKHPDLKYIVNFQFVNNSLNFTKSEQPKKIEEISNYIFNYISKETLDFKPTYIQDIRYEIFNETSFHYSPSYYIETLEKSKLEEAIRRKITKVTDYKKKSKCEIQWLLIVIGDKLEYDGSLYEINIDPSFDKVFLMEYHSFKLWQIL
ncbi:hypothetical protein [Arcicella lustrica]|uniref:Uncharacterized protein n=1 Tax=Arcicella lustrica TaxID=2984196 RepID=A0ABU5SJE7_9BACT|nr:hypothetical protein [Arcicella sp. DC25W]MEA5427391.1 hypothetical protein [Arcicella sp. DC25W]